MRHLMHVREIRTALGSASVTASMHELGRAPWWNPRRWLADRLAEAYHRGRADAMRDVLTGHRAAVVEGAR